MSVPRGVSLANPGNIRRGDPWRGLTVDQPDKDFCKFSSPVWGFRALALNLLAYQRLGVRTIKDVITRWAPPSENNTQAYIDAVSQDMRLSPTQLLDLTHYNDAYALCKAITTHEQGSFDQYFTKEQLDEGLAKAKVKIA
jgi:hypothetical protein